MAAAKGILLSCAKEKLVEFGGYIDLNRHWVFSLLKRMNFVKRKATMSKSKYSIENFAKAKNFLLKSITEIVATEEIPPELVLNWDQTGLNIVPSSSWTMDQRGQKRIELIGLKDKRQITAVFCCSIQGAFLPLQVIYKGTTQRCHPKHKFPPGWHITHSKNHWSNENTMIEYIEKTVSTMTWQY